MSQRFFFPRLAGCFALFVVASAALAQTPAASPPPVSTHDTAQPMLPAQLQDFGAYVDSARKTFDVPGIAVAIVKDGQVVLEQGFGLREIGKPAKVDADTLFAIASNTKAFTAASLQ